MKVATVKLTSTTPMAQGKYLREPKLERELPGEYEERTWKKKVHETDGKVVIPPMAIKNCLAETAKFMSIQVPGKGKATYTKHFKAGVLVSEAVDTGVKLDDVEGLWLLVPADGVKGSGKRVEKCFPVVKQWKGEVKIFIVDELITRKVLEEHLKYAGQLMGLGSLRIGNGGLFGGFTAEVTSFGDFV